MICREYLENYYCVYLYNCLSTYEYQLSITVVNSNSLTYRILQQLSTLFFFGAKLISLYLFSAKNCGKVSKKH